MIIINNRAELDRLHTTDVYNIGLGLIKNVEIREKFIYLITHTNVKNMNEAYDIVYAEIMQQSLLAQHQK